MNPAALATASAFLTEWHDLPGERELAAWGRSVLSTLPGAEHLPAKAQAALLSLLMSRGTRMDGDDRASQRAVRTAVNEFVRGKLSLRHALERIAGHVRGMDATTARTRRAAEADLILSCLNP